MEATHGKKPPQLETEKSMLQNVMYNYLAATLNENPFSVAFSVGSQQLPLLKLGGLSPPYYSQWVGEGSAPFPPPPPRYA